MQDIEDADVVVHRRPLPGEKQFAYNSVRGYGCRFDAVTCAVQPCQLAARTQQLRHLAATACAPVTPARIHALQFRSKAQSRGIPFVSLWDGSAAEVRQSLLPVFALYAGLAGPDEVSSKGSLAARGQRAGQGNRRGQRIRL